MNTMLQPMSVFIAVAILLVGDGRETSSFNGQREAIIDMTPHDTRVIINAPAFRMDLFEDGKLIKSYKIGIGYREYPADKYTS